MTIIELFDKPSIELIISALIKKPEKIIFIGSKSNMQEYADLYKKIYLEHTGKEIDFSCVKVDRNDLSAIIDRIVDIVDNNEDNYIIDLDGGEDLFLVAAGIAYERCVNKPELHRYNCANNSLYDCDEDGKVKEEIRIEISIEENLAIHGGKIIYEDSGNNTYTYIWDFNEQFKKDVVKMWDICKYNPSVWNWLFSTIANSETTVIDNLALSVDESQLLNVSCTTILKNLERIGVINNLQISESISFTYKNAQIAKSLEQAGTILELYTTVCAMDLASGGKPLYNDVMMGVQIDWDGDIHSDDDEVRDVQNEIDVILSKGVVPVFISCKNGEFTADELYKLTTVSNKFGKKYAKRVLVSSSLSELDSRKRMNKQEIEDRARDLNIRVISDVAQMSREEFLKVLKNIWRC